VLTISVVIVAVLIFAATKPNSFRLQRSITIHAPQEKVFAFINDLHSWESWSDESENDRTAQKNYTGPASGIGAAVEWHGSGRAASARMTIIESVTPSKVSVNVDWRKPFKAHNLNEFTIRAQGDATAVTWSIQASHLYPMKVVGIFVDIQSEFGKHMESALKNLKSVAKDKGSEPIIEKIPS
jgi:carbon monoxide dehydrogenase subunit G